MANYLYDVSDGQMRIGEVRIYDEKQHWDEADFIIYSNNMIHPHVDSINGVFRNSGGSADPIEMPRKWFGSKDKSRNGTASEFPLDMTAGDDYRTRLHEFGHYAFGFYDEYLFWNDGLFGLFQGYERDDGSGDLRCRPRSEMTYGFMDYQYSFGDNIALGYASEMSSKYRYQDAGFRNQDLDQDPGDSHNLMGLPPKVHLLIDLISSFRVKLLTNKNTNIQTQSKT